MPDAGAGSAAKPDAGVRGRTRTPPASAPENPHRRRKADGRAEKPTAGPPPSGADPAARVERAEPAYFLVVPLADGDFLAAGFSALSAFDSALADS